MIDKKIKLGIIGTGRIAKRMVSDAKVVTNLEIYSIYNPHYLSSQAFAKECGISKYYGNLEQFLATVDAVYIASPHETHVNYTRESLLAGKHVLCEKPMAFSKLEAKELFQLAKEKNLVLMEAFKTAYCPGYQALCETVLSGKIGDVYDVEACFCKLTAPELREMKDERYGGSVTELASYVLLPIIQILGSEISEVQFKSIKAPTGIDLYTKIILEYNNAMALGKVGLGVKSEAQLIIAGTKGYILAESPWWLTKKFEVRYEDTSKTEEYSFPFEQNGLHYELDAFKNSILSNKRVNDSEKISIAIADLLHRFMETR